MCPNQNPRELCFSCYEITLFCSEKKWDSSPPTCQLHIRLPIFCSEISFFDCKLLHLSRFPSWKTGGFAVVPSTSRRLPEPSANFGGSWKFQAQLTWHDPGENVEKIHENCGWNYLKMPRLFFEFMQRCDLLGDDSWFVTSFLQALYGFQDPSSGSCKFQICCHAGPELSAHVYSSCVAWSCDWTQCWGDTKTWRPSYPTWSCWHWSFTNPNSDKSRALGWGQTILDLEMCSNFHCSSRGDLHYLASCCYRFSSILGTPQPWYPQL